MDLFKLILLYTVFPFFMLVAAVSDIFTMKITNKLTLMFAVIFIPIIIIFAPSWGVIGWHFLAGFLVLAFGFALFACGVMGGGDAKFLAVTALWLGLGTPLVSFVIFVGLFGGVEAIIFLIWRRLSLPKFLNNYDWIKILHTKGAKIPYGVAIGGAGICAYLLSPWVNQYLA